MNPEATWMGPWVIGLKYGLKGHKEQVVMGSKSHGQPPLFNEGYLCHFNGQRAGIKGPLPALAVT